MKVPDLGHSLRVYADAATSITLDEVTTRTPSSRRTKRVLRVSIVLVLVAVAVVVALTATPTGSPTRSRVQVGARSTVPRSCASAKGCGIVHHVGPRASLTTGVFRATYVPTGYTLLSALAHTEITGDEIYRLTYHAGHGTTPIVIESRRNLHTMTVSGSTLTGAQKVDADHLLPTLNGMTPIRRA